MGLVILGLVVLLSYIDLKRILEKIMAQIDDFNSALSTVSADVTAVQADVASVLQELKDAQADDTPVDLSSAISVLTQIHTNLSTVDAGLKAAIVPATSAPAASGTDITPAPATAADVR